MNRCITLIAAGATAGVLMAAVAAQSGQDRQPERRQSAERTTLEGKVVDMHHYLTSSEDSEQATRQRNHGGPVGILVTSSGVLGTTEAVHLVVFAPPTDERRPSRDRDAQQGQDRNPEMGQDRDARQGRAMYERIQRMVGQDVVIAGTTHERNDIKAIAIEEIRTHPRPDQRQQPDREHPQRR